MNIINRVQLKECSSEAI
ncbi:tetracycline resistance efflux system leader peptide [uncultured Chryseobacterium sp.]